METRFININKHQIAYFDNQIDSNDTIVCIHGNSSSKESFRDFANLVKDKRVIAFDLYGHGESEWAKDPSLYTLNGYTDLVKDFLGNLNLSNIHLLGHSLGGHIAIESLPDIEENLKSLITFGTPPLSGASDFAVAFNPTTYLEFLFKQNLSNNEAQLISYALSKEAADKVCQGFLNTDGKARHTLGASLNEGNVVNEIKILNNTNIFYRIIYGQSDDLVNINYMEKISKEHGIDTQKENLPHYPSLDSLDLFNKIINEAILQVDYHE